MLSAAWTDPGHGRLWRAVRRRIERMSKRGSSRRRPRSLRQPGRWAPSPTAEEIASARAVAPSRELSGPVQLASASQTSAEPRSRFVTTPLPSTCLAFRRGGATTRSRLSQRPRPAYNGGGDCLIYLELRCNALTSQSRMLRQRALNARLSADQDVPHPWSSPYCDPGSTASTRQGVPQGTATNPLGTCRWHPLVLYLAPR